MGLRTHNQQDQFDNSALLGQQRPARIAGVQPPPFMQGGTMQIRQDLPPRGAEADLPARNLAAAASDRLRNQEESAGGTQAVTL